MRIAFDAKRAFQNSTGLGHYSRTLIESLAKGFPEHDYYLMAPRPSGMFTLPENARISVVHPRGIAKTFPSLWRSNWVKQDLQRLSIDLYHGLSHEIPVGIQHTGIRSVVTIHDLIFEHYPKQYKAIDVAIYRKKFRYACRHANRIIAISEQTRNDIVAMYGIAPEKITVCYQSCNPIFSQVATDAEKDRVRKTYRLPPNFLLYVGSIIERKNLLNLCKAYKTIKEEIQMPLIVIGNGSGAYFKAVKTFIQQQGLAGDIIMLSEQEYAKDEPGYRNSADLPAIYQLATAMIYPSMFEGFGLPVLEALWSGLPVITSYLSCLPEAGGDAAAYVDPTNTDELAGTIKNVVANDTLRAEMIARGYIHANKFSTEATSAAVMQVYLDLMK